MVDDLSVQFSSNPIAQAISNEGILAVICAPLTVSGDLIGSLNLGSELPSGFDLEHREIVREVADSLAIAIHSARLLETVTSHSGELQRLSARLINIQEEERKHISYELHDEIGQVLTAITYNLAAISRDLPQPVSAKTANRLSDSEELVNQVMERIRDMSLQLRPSMLQDLGLIPTLRWYINQYGERMNLNVEFSADEIECPLDESTETTLYRFVQEGLTNAARHACANKISVSLECKGELILATVKDDGIGFDTDSSDDVRTSLDGTGLLGIRERLAPLGGQLKIESAVGQGTVLRASTPMGEQNEEN
jgi:signal transduction histidine kinase